MKTAAKTRKPSKPAKAKPAKTTAKPAPAKKAKKPNQVDRMLKLMSRPNGVSIDEALTAMPMQLHSLRGLVSTVAKTHSLKVRFDRETRRYHVIND